jgi:hypothetical protein
MEVVPMVLGVFGRLALHEADSAFRVVFEVDGVVVVGGHAQVVVSCHLNRLDVLLVDKEGVLRDEVLEMILSRDIALETTAAAS